MREVSGMAMLAVIVAALVGIAYGWSKSYDEVRNAELRTWRRTTALVGILAVTLQAVLFIAIWTPLGRHDALVTWLTRGEALLFLIALPCVLTRRDRSRWWLLFSSTALAVFYFLTILVSEAA
jgi:cytochrome bd-type quinol oxidase subunit 2